jgi:hypothetical protein
MAGKALANQRQEFQGGKQILSNINDEYLADGTPLTG